MSQGIISTAVNYNERVLIYQLNLTNGENINSKYSTSNSWSMPYGTLFYDDKIYVILRCSSDPYLCKCSSNYNLIVMVDTQKDEIYNYKFVKPSNPYFLFKDPFTDR